VKIRISSDGLYFAVASLALILIEIFQDEWQKEGADKDTATDVSISPNTENPLCDQYVYLFSSDSQKPLLYPSKEFLASFEEEISEAKTKVGEEEEDVLSTRANWIDESVVGSSDSQEPKAISVASLKLAGEEVVDPVSNSMQASASPVIPEVVPKEANYLE
jgi:hypothetical protein